MQSIELQRVFNEYSKKFKSDNYNLETIENLVDDIRFSIPKLTKYEIKLLLDIPISVLKHDVDIKDLKAWQRENSTYFSGNMCLENEEFVSNLQEKFLDGDFYLEDIIDIAVFVKDNYETLAKKHGRALEIILRNVECTLRDVTLINISNFNASGNIFAKYIDKAINHDW
jgi:hypothetical protein